MEIHAHTYDMSGGYQGVFKLEKMSVGEIYWRYIVGTSRKDFHLNESTFSPQKTIHHDKFRSCGKAEFDDLDLREIE